MKNLLIIGNWKLNGNQHTIKKMLNALNDKLSNISKNIRIAIAPPIVYLDTVKNYLSNKNYIIELCAQNVDSHLSGAFTGEVSALMLKDLNVQYVLIGHSERRIYHKEDNISIIKKISILNKLKLTPILCIGENKTEHDTGHTQSVCINQIDIIIKSIGIQSFKKIVIAYEPIWAIGSGVNASPNEVQILNHSIRKHISKYDTRIAKQVLIQYGGSVNLNNIIQYISQKDIDGVLIGAASLDPNNFLDIIESIENHIQHQQQLNYY